MTDIKTITLFAKSVIMPPILPGLILLFVYSKLNRHFSLRLSVIVSKYLLIAFCVFQWLVLAYKLSFTSTYLEDLQNQLTFNTPYLLMRLALLVFSLFLPLLLLLRKVGTKTWLVMLVALLTNFGVYFEKYVIIVTTLQRDYSTTDYFDLSLLLFSLVLTPFLFTVLFIIIDAVKKRMGNRDLDNVL